MPHDKFDYQLRSKNEVIDEFKHFMPTFPIIAAYKKYTAGDVRQNVDDNLDNRERVAKIRVDIRDLQLAPLQRERFQFLLGSRHNPVKPHYCKIVISQYNSF